MKNEIYDIIIVGAGMSGISAAKQLIRNGLKVKILDKGKVTGGRLATRRIKYGTDHVVFDYGCRYIESKSSEFSQEIVDLIKKNIVKEWNVINHNAVLDALEKDIRFIGKNSIREIALEFARGLEIENNSRVVKIKRNENIWNVYIENNIEYKASQLILSLPIPQSLELIRNSKIKLQQKLLANLAKVEYNRNIMALLILEKGNNLNDSGSLKFSEGDISFISDNNIKGINNHKGALTIEMSNEFSIKYWDIPDDLIAQKIIKSAEDFIKSDVIDFQVHKWKFSTPKVSYNKRYELVEQPGPIYFIGDAFLGSNVESAYLSGLYSANNILSTYSRKLKVRES